MRLPHQADLAAIKPQTSPVLLAVLRFHFRLPLQERHLQPPALSALVAPLAHQLKLPQLQLQEHRLPALPQPQALTHILALDPAWISRPIVGPFASNWTMIVLTLAVLGTT